MDIQTFVQGIQCHDIGLMPGHNDLQKVSMEGCGAEFWESTIWLAS